MHLDGYNITDTLASNIPSPRKECFYFNDDGSLVALRHNPRIGFLCKGSAASTHNTFPETQTVSAG